MENFIDVTILAVLQGVAEFLPISSSGHLVILQQMLDVPEALRLRLEVFLHVGTLISVFVFYARCIGGTVAGMVRGERKACEFAGKILVSTFPAILVYFFFRHEIEALVTNVRMVGALLMFTGAVLVGTRYLPRGGRDVNWLRAVFMGVGQAIALLPGVSRSGMTLATARGGRVDADAAAEFSFLMSAPLILGGLLLEILKGEIPQVDCPFGTLVWGTLLAAVVGYFSLALLVKALKGRWFWLFGPYCIVAGLVVLCFCR